MNNPLWLVLIIPALLGLVSLLMFLTERAAKEISLLISKNEQPLETGENGPERRDGG